MKDWFSKFLRGAQTTLEVAKQTGPVVGAIAAGIDAAVPDPSGGSFLAPEAPRDPQLILEAIQALQLVGAGSLAFETRALPAGVLIAQGLRQIRTLQATAEAA